MGNFSWVELETLFINSYNIQQKNRSHKSQINNLNCLIDDLQSQSKLNANGSHNILKVR